MTPGFKLPKVYAIINFQDTDNPEAFAEILLAAGVKLIQLRDKSENLHKLHEAALAILKIRNHLSPQAKIIINDHVELSMEIMADGVHLGQTDSDPVSARRKLGKSAIIGLSTHSKEQAINAPHSSLDYVACGPVFHSKTKSGHAPELGLDGVMEIRKALSDVCTLPLVAIGGINFTTAKSVLEAGADSLAMIRALHETGNLHGEILKL
jgi:thiamine-phosphate pyrophosphorylase